MKGFLTFIIIFILGLLLWPTVSRWIRAWVMRKVQAKTEDYLRSAMGMPPRDTGRNNRRKRRAEDPAASRARPGATRRRGVREPLIPKEYAVDVEYTEIKSYSSDTVIAPDRDQTDKIRIRQESQVSDAEWVEIKPKRS